MYFWSNLVSLSYQRRFFENRIPACVLKQKRIPFLKRVFYVENIIHCKPHYILKWYEWNVTENGNTQDSLAETGFVHKLSIFEIFVIIICGLFRLSRMYCSGAKLSSLNFINWDQNIIYVEVPSMTFTVKLIYALEFWCFKRQSQLRPFKY